MDCLRSGALQRRAGVAASAAGMRNVRHPPTADLETNARNHARAPLPGLAANLAGTLSWLKIASALVELESCLCRSVSRSSPATLCKQHSF